MNRFMLTSIEKDIFFLAVCISLYLTWRGVRRVVICIASAQGKPEWQAAFHSIWKAFINTITLKPTFQIRPWSSLFHGLVAWGFMLYILVNLGDVLQAFMPGFVFLGTGWLGNFYRLSADGMSAAVLTGMAYFSVRRFVIRPDELKLRSQTSQARFGIQRDSAIVASFIILHVGARLLGQSIVLAHSETTDNWQPIASALIPLWRTFSPAALLIAEHIAFWFALGLILAFFPYFPYSKHIHIFFAPLNFLLKPNRRSMGELSALDFEDETKEQFGATKLTDLGWEQIMDGYACVMCFRCQEVCPAYSTGKELSPAAIEINKRYYLNQFGKQIEQDKKEESHLTEWLISEEAVWQCTACGACVQVCPLGNEPMRDILDIRRSLVLMENRFPEPLKAAYRGMERYSNPWNLAPAERCAWTKGLDVVTVKTNPHPELLWWVGCAPATDARAQKTAQAFVQLLQKTQTDYAILGELEACTGDAARRSGKEDIFFELALRNISTLDEVAPQLIVTTCPHCLHTLKNEYPAFGGHYNVVHHTHLIQEWIQMGKLNLQVEAQKRITYHDPCYLGRQNGIYDAPRDILKHTAAAFVEMKDATSLSFCCGAGGAQMWKEETPHTEKISHKRFHQAEQTQADILMTACPFCLTMLTDEAKTQNSQVQLMDLAEWVLQQCE